MAGSARAIAARMQGDDYQARWFFIQALRMFDRGSPVTSVALEQGHFPWFDDIVTRYAPGKSVRRAADAHQIKFHVVADGALSFESMVDPSFVGSTTTSLLQRIVEANRATRGEADVVLMSPWVVHPDGLLASMAQTGTDGTLRLPLLFDRKQKSDAAKMRRMLAAHVGVDEDELRDALDRFRVEVTPPLARLQSMLDDKLDRHRFVTVGETAIGNIYDDLGRKLIARPNREFDATTLRALLHEERLVQTGSTRNEPLRVGIRSFTRQAEYLDEFTTLLDVLDAFDGRYIRPGVGWNTVRDRVQAFVTDVDDRHPEEIEMHLSCHISIAFAAGHAVSAQSPTRYVVHQPGIRGGSDWDLSTRAAGAPESLWSVREVRLREDAPDVAVTLGLTHSIADDVAFYVGRHVPAVGTILVLEPVGGPSQTVVRDGAHAAALAEAFDQLVATRRSPEQRMAMLHLFAAAPNGFTFALGRASRRVARTTLYEYDFVRKSPEGYSAAIILDTP